MMFQIEYPPEQILINSRAQLKFRATQRVYRYTKDNAVHGNNVAMNRDA